MEKLCRLLLSASTVNPSVALPHSHVRGDAQTLGHLPQVEGLRLSPGAIFRCPPRGVFGELAGNWSCWGAVWL